MTEGKISSLIAEKGTVHIYDIPMPMKMCGSRWLCDLFGSEAQ